MAGGAGARQPARIRGGKATARRAVAFSFAGSLLLAAAAAGEPAGLASPPGHDWGFEVKAAYRDSEYKRIPSPFGFPSSFLPVGQTQGFLETVDEGRHYEVAVVTLFYKGAWENGLATKVKVDLVDKWDRNPTTSDRPWDIDEAWLRWGPEVEPGGSHEGLSAYVKLGKFSKFERQDDRHLESYGLVSTAFNRMEDVGLEVGFDLGKHFYLKTSLTQGNPVFIRDVNALAGDNGTPERDPILVTNPDPKVKGGVPIFYDADVDELDFANPETGLGLGARFSNDSGRVALDVLAWGYVRDLADAADLYGTFYNGDLDVITGPFPDGFGPFPPTRPPALEGREKLEYGVNVWFYAGGFSLFGQYVDQELANLPRKGYELELAYEWEMPYLELFGQQVFSFIAPAVRYSKLEPEFVTAPTYPAPSVRWEWEKVDLGLRLGLISGLDVTFEINENEFLRGPRANIKDGQDEYLATFRYNWARKR